MVAIRVAAALLFLFCSGAAWSQGKPAATKHELLVEMLLLTGSSGTSAEEMAGVYGIFLEEKELREIVAFFRSDAGQKYVAAQEKVRIASMPLEDLQREMGENQRRRTQLDMRSLAVALETLALDRGTYPVGSDFAAAAAKLEPKYMKSVPRRDAWNTPFRYAGTAESYRLVSAGPDGQFSGSSLKSGAKPDPKSDDLVMENGRFLLPPE
jgi:hypothetical protein